MHPYILDIPNRLFYDNQIKSKYKVEKKTKFLCTNTPFIFVNSETREKQYGESFMNKGEADLVV